MKIIKKGIIPIKARRFTCSNCGCIFECEEGEYEVHFDHFDDYCTAACPTCGDSCLTPDHEYK